MLTSWEAYWDMPRGSFADDTSSPSDVKEQIIGNILAAAKQAGIQHLVVVDNDASFTSQLDATGIPYTSISCTAPLTNTPDYSFKEGVISDLNVVDVTIDGKTSATVAAAYGEPVCREDLAALCVQSLQSLSWSKSRRLAVSCTGAVKVPTLSAPPKRIDQQWCVNAFVLEEKLSGVA